MYNVNHQALSPPPFQNTVISTEAEDSFTVRCAAERSPHLAFVVSSGES